MKKVLIILLCICFIALCACEPSLPTNEETSQETEFSLSESLRTTSEETTQETEDTVSEPLRSGSEEITQETEDAVSESLHSESEEITQEMEDAVSEPLRSDSEETTQETEDTASEPLHSESEETTQETEEIMGQSSLPSIGYSYGFESYQGIIKALTLSTSNNFKILREEQVYCPETYQKALAKFASGEIRVAIPQLNGSPIPIQNREGYAKVSLFSDELYGLPWLCYHYSFDGQNAHIKISYLTFIENLEADPQDSYLDILESFYPSAPSPDNYPKWYESIYEKQLVLEDGVSVTALVSVSTNDSIKYVGFRYDDLLVVLCCKGEMLSDEFWQSFSIAYN